MCLALSSEKSAHKIAKKDITVYKHLYVVNNEYFTPYRHANVKFNTIIESILDRYGYYVFQGIHSFVSIRRCKMDALWENSHVVVKCTIPAGSQYYRGSFNASSSIASDKIRYDEVILSRKYTYELFKNKTDS